MNTDNNTIPIPVATFAEFLALEAQENDICNFSDSISDLGLEMPKSTEELLQALSCDTSDNDDVIYIIGSLAAEFISLGKTMNEWTAAYHKQTGQTKLTLDALDRFLEEPSSENQQSLIEASQIVADNPAKLPKKYAAKLRPFITKRLWRSNIRIGNLEYIAKNYLKFEDPFLESGPFPDVPPAFVEMTPEDENWIRTSSNSQ